MKFTESQNQKINDHLTKYWTDSQCPICHSTKWELSEVPVEVREWEGGSLLIGTEASVLPLVALMCDKCGYIRFFSALKIGVVQPSDFKDVAEFTLKRPEGKGQGES